ARAEALHRHAAGGAMLALRAEPAEVAEALARATAADPAFGAVGIAAHNGPGAVVVAGPRERIDALRGQLTEWKPTALETDYAFHHPGLGPAAEEIERALAPLRPRPAAVPLYSTTTGAHVEGVALDAAHWAANAARPVAFRPAVDGLLNDGITAFVELGPHPALTSHLRRAARAASVDAVAVPTLRRDRDERVELWRAVGALWSAGLPVDWARLHPGRHPVVPLPTYPWQRRRHWLPGVAGPPAPEAGGGPGAERPAEPVAAPDATAERVLNLLVTEVARVMEVSPDELPPDRPTRHMDVDSVVFVELKSRLENELGVAIPLTALTEGLSLREIAQRLAAPGPRVPTVEEAHAALDRLDELSEAEVEQILKVLETNEEW
ncbi:acyltransferase domain-containing protein, partial [Streptomyces triticirhizae]